MRRILPIVAAGLLFVAACGDDDQSAADDAASTDVAAQVDDTATDVDGSDDTATDVDGSDGSDDESSSGGCPEFEICGDGFIATFESLPTPDGTIAFSEGDDDLGGSGRASQRLFVDGDSTDVAESWQAALHDAGFDVMDVGNLNPGEFTWVVTLSGETVNVSIRPGSSAPTQISLST